MKKCLMSMLALMMVAAVSLCFVSCGDDDDDPKISIVGTWTFDYGDEGYCTLTFSGTATSGTMTIVSNEKGRIDTETSRYIYKDGYLYLPDLEDYDEFGAIEVISLTETKLVLRNFPDDGKCTLTRSRATEQTTSLVGTWTFDYGDEGYCTLTFSGTATSGTMTIVSNEKGRIDTETSRYIYKDGYLYLPDLEDYDEFGAIEVISLTETKLVLRDFPDDGKCTLTRSKYKQ